MEKSSFETKWQCSQSHKKQSHVTIMMDFNAAYELNIKINATGDTFDMVDGID